VVLFWALFMKFRKSFARGFNAVADVVSSTPFLVVAGTFVAIAYVWALFTTELVLGLTLGVLVSTLMIASGLAGWVMGWFGTSYEDMEIEDTKWARPIIMIVAVVGLAGIPVFLISRLVKNWKHEWTEFFEKVGPTMVLASGVVFLGLLLTWLGMETAWYVPVVVVASVIGAGFGLYAIARVLAYARDRVVAFNDAEYEKYEQGLRDGTIQPRAEKQGPGRVKRFFYALNDFFTLIGQAIRVNKWKICPTVSIDTRR
jgi:hypothetical protein